MAEITLLPNWDGGGTRRIWRGVKTTARAAVVAGKIFGFLALGVGGGIGGVSLIASGANILTSTDNVLRVMGTAAPSSGHSEYPGRDPFSTRRTPQPPPTPEESVYLTRTEALFTFGFGLLIAALSLGGFFGAWFEAAEAFDAIRRRSGRQ